MFSKLKSNLKRSKSFDYLNAFKEQDQYGYCVYNDYILRHLNKSHKEASHDAYSNCSEVSFTEVKSDVNVKRNNVNVNFDKRTIASIEYKIDKINEILLEQHYLLKTLKEYLTNSNVEPNTTSEPTPKYDTPSESLESLEQLTRGLEKSKAAVVSNSNAQTLLDAIEQKRSHILDLQIKDVLSHFLQNDGLKDHITEGAVESLKLVISNYFKETFPKAYMPILENSYRRFFKHVTRVIQNAFDELEENSTTLHRSVYRASRTLRAALEKHQVLLEASRPSKNMLRNLQNTLDEVLNAEMKEWRHSLLQVFTHQQSLDETSPNDACNNVEEATYESSGPSQPLGPENFVIGQLMKSAEIYKYIQEGNINKSFEEALSSADLSLVMTACRAADPVRVFAEPCALSQAVLLSLTQQLATDMLHDTQLKCRYLEDALINLNTTDPATRIHLPVVVQDVRKHLSTFLQSYPSHIAIRRIRFIIMAAKNMIN